MKRIHLKRVFFIVVVFTIVIALPLMWADFDEGKLQEKYMPVEEVKERFFMQ